MRAATAVWICLPGICLLAGCHQSQGLWTKGYYVPSPGNVDLTYAYHVRGDICGAVGQDKTTQAWQAYTGTDQLRDASIVDLGSAQKAVEKACD